MFYLSRLLAVFTTGRGSFGWQNQVFNNAPYYVSVMHLGYILLGLGLLGLLFVCINYKRYVFLLGTSIYLFFYLVIFPKFTTAAFDIMRSRFIILFIASLFIAYALYQIITMCTGKLKIPKIYIVLAIVILFIIAGLPGQFALVKQMKFQHLSPEKYSPLLWIQDNTPDDARVFFLDGYQQLSSFYSKRVSGFVEIPELTKHLERFYTENNTLSLDFDMQIGLRTELGTSALSCKKNFFVLEKDCYDFPGNKHKITDFDYIVISPISEQTVPYDKAMAELLVAKFNYTQVYAQYGTMILGREK
jgi:hypothetical protein